MKELPYDKTDAYSIEGYAKKLLDKSLRDVLKDLYDLELKIKAKGSLGQTTEKYYFLYENNSKSEPDFPEAGVELKTTPVITDNKVQLKAKERLVFNIINYEQEVRREFIDSSFWTKNKLLLLMFYLHEKDEIDIDLVFKLIRLFRFPAVDLKIIKDDWEKIKSKIIAGKAHELSEGDTFYLGACTKGANNTPTRKQPFSNELAKQRAYSLKPKYLNVIIQKTLKGEHDLIDQTDDYRRILENNIVADPLAKYSKVKKDGSLSPVVKHLDDFENQTIEQVIVSKFDRYLNKTAEQIFEELGKDPNKKAKNYYDRLTKTILGVNVESDIEEFEKAEITIKTIRLKENDLPKEDISFPAFKFEGIINEHWDESAFKEILEHKFLFVFFQFIDDRLVLRKVKFWNMPYKDILEAEKVWIKTRELIRNGEIVKEIKKGRRSTYFPNKSYNSVAHVRPHARNIEDTYPLPTPDKLTGVTNYTKYCFWLNSQYVREEIYRKF